MAVEILVTPEDVAAAYPTAPAVTADQVQQARDWAEPLLEGAGVVLLPNSRQERAARRAVMLYALSLTATGVARRSQTSAGAGITAERKKIGDLEKEVRYAASYDASSAAYGAADSYLLDAWAALYAAGLPRPVRVAGASR